MSEETTLETRIQTACDIASGKTPTDPAASGAKIRGGYKDLNSKGSGPEWYRMVYRNGWTYVSEERLPNGSYRASDRRATVYGEVFPGEIVVGHNRGGPVDTAWLISSPNEKGEVLNEIQFRKRRDGQLTFVLPDGTEVTLSNPRRK